MPLSLLDFVARWQSSSLKESAGAKLHFVDLCEALGQPHPGAVDQVGSYYTFEKGAAKVGGGQGFADVWFQGRFAWEYKGPGKSLDAAYQQLLQYREDLENPPLLVVCDLNRFEIHTNFTGTIKRVYAFDLAELAAGATLPNSAFTPLFVLHALFEDPERLRPQQTTAQVTEAAAGEFAKLADSLRKRGEDPEQAARFLMRLLFSLFAEDIGLLPPHLFTQLIERTKQRPIEFDNRLRQLFSAMATGGSFGVEDILHFNGGLFADDEALQLTTSDLEILAQASKLDWASVEPAIFGTLFERSLDPSKRSQLGAHYTSRADILLVVEPVLMAPLRRKWEHVQQQAQALIARREGAAPATRTNIDKSLATLLLDFTDEIAAVRVLDPACGSGNFLYVALRLLLDLEKQVSIFAAKNGLPGLLPKVQPAQLFGIELNVYAHELASVVVWIGYVQWLHDNGFGYPSSPILKRLDNIIHMDAIMAYDAGGNYFAPIWPDADVIIGNPPFVGGNKIRQALRDRYVDDLFKLYEGRVPAFADLVVYWFERAREQVEAKRAQRVGLLATQAIRGGVNRRVLQRIKQEGDIFLAWSDRTWILEGAAVHVSIIGFDNGDEKTRLLDGMTVNSINADLTSVIDVTQAQRLAENQGLCFIGTKKAGAFDLDQSEAQQMLHAPQNPNGRTNSDVVLPWLNGQAVVQRLPQRWIIYFGDLSEEDAALYERPFEYVRKLVYPERQ